MADVAAAKSVSFVASDRDGSVYIDIEPKPQPQRAQLTEKSPLLPGAEAKRKAAYYAAKHSDCGCSSVSFGKNSEEKMWTCQLVAVAIFILFGFSVATYLMAVDDRLPTIRFALDLVSRSAWSRMAILRGEPLDHSKVTQVIVLQTGGDECNESQDCVHLLRSMQKLALQTNNTEIPFNFLIGGNGQTYEIRGWEYENGFSFLPKKSSLVIGFIGNYTTKSPTSDQLQNGASLINESIRRQKLQSNYLLYTGRNLTLSHLDGEELFLKVSNWPNFDTMLKVL